MEDGGPSVTARLVAAHRLGFARVDTDYGDPAADEALAADVAAGRAAPASRMHDYLAARTSFFDRTVVGAIDRGRAPGRSRRGRCMTAARSGTPGRASAGSRSIIPRPSATSWRGWRGSVSPRPTCGSPRPTSPATRWRTGCARPGSTPARPPCSCSKGSPSTWNFRSWRPSSTSSGRSPPPAASWPSACPCRGSATTPPGPGSGPGSLRSGSRPVHAGGQRGRSPARPDRVADRGRPGG